MIRVVLFEDNKSLRESLSMYFSNTDDVFLAGAFPNAKEANWVVRKYKPDVVLMDIQMPHVSGLEAMADIKKLFPNVKVLIQTVFEDDERIFQAICAGASGYLVKNPDPKVYIQAIKEVHGGGSHLSPSIAKRVLEMFQSKYVRNEATYIELTKREQDVLNCLVKGLSYKMIADTCGISFSTVCTHVNHIYEKLHVNSAPEAVVKAFELRLV
jgi:DNA-binding NarL/FixJ family response regulator